MRKEEKKKNRTGWDGLWCECVYTLYSSSCIHGEERTKERERERENGTREQTSSAFSSISIYTTDITYVLSTSAVFIFCFFGCRWWRSFFGACSNVTGAIHSERKSQQQRIREAGQSVQCRWETVCLFLL